jgi:hypothetical protein
MGCEEVMLRFSLEDGVAREDVRHMEIEQVGCEEVMARW